MVNIHMFPQIFLHSFKTLIHFGKKQLAPKSVRQCTKKMEILAVMETCFWGTEGASKLKYSIILIWLLCMWMQLKNILPSNDLIL